ncbi:helix-turn-helix transcriptional regulator [Aureimonas jatrophae]|jgi:transcriptional regulator with XRE-family HTH domain|uniref:Helix-turn-helix domain-containing protein n=1 Tax=Aureimonas jatrophae TaxID=1166073 RepID=A0A1H0HSV3_9HYPH|nr:helix-turn-helix transcriptional regulator [Aureimonas jatrophae]MBB3950758.1 transcriptional regulator with XRE-family HTH domain [Aureimonas jatrophae]SDO22227.1 Helix-turn-helix domain-containing protein [Aureimonas jatrophae]
MSKTSDNALGTFLKNRRTRMDPASFGFGGRRRTQGLRREEVALRANISPTWYTWLEQGRGGAPSADVLERIAKGLMLTEPEREHLFVLGLGRPPAAASYSACDAVTPRLQRVLDAFPASPAIIKTATWDVVAWNRAAATLLTDYSQLPRDQRNILRLVFTNSRVKAAQADWLAVARYVVGAFRAEAARAGARAEIERLVEELSLLSPEFASLWRDNDVSGHADGVKRLRHPEHGLLELEFSAFSVEGRPDLGLIVYNPASPETARRIAALLAAAGAPPAT